MWNRYFHVVNVNCWDNSNIILGKEEAKVRLSARKHELECEIAKLLREFHEETELYISDLRIERMGLVNAPEVSDSRPFYIKGVKVVVEAKVL